MKLLDYTTTSIITSNFKEVSSTKLYDKFCFAADSLCKSMWNMNEGIWFTK